MRGERPEVLLHTGDTRVRATRGALLVERRATFLLAIGAGCVGVAAGLLGIEALAGEREAWTRWFAWVLASLGAVNLGLAALRGLASPIRFDVGLRELIRGDLRVPFERLGPPRIVETPIAGQVAVSLTIEAPSGSLRLIDGQLARERPAVERVARRIAAMIAAERPAKVARAEGSARGFKVALLLVLGAVWAASGWWLAPEVVWTWPGGAGGVRVWPLGLWIAGLGALELAGARVFDAMVGPWTRRRALLFAAWMGSYLALNLVRP